MCRHTHTQIHIHTYNYTYTHTYTYIVDTSDWLTPQGLGGPTLTSCKLERLSTELLLSPRSWTPQQFQSGTEGMEHSWRVAALPLMLGCQRSWSLMALKMAAAAVEYSLEKWRQRSRQAALFLDLLMSGLPIGKCHLTLALRQSLSPSVKAFRKCLPRPEDTGMSLLDSSSRPH